MSTVQEIRSAIGRLSAQERALLAAELFALKAEPEAEELDKSLARGCPMSKKVACGRSKKLGA